MSACRRSRGFEVVDCLFTADHCQSTGTFVGAGWVRQLNLLLHNPRQAATGNTASGILEFSALLKIKAVQRLSIAHRAGRTPPLLSAANCQTLP